MPFCFPFESNRLSTSFPLPPTAFSTPSIAAAESTAASPPTVTEMTRSRPLSAIASISTPRKKSSRIDLNCMYVGCESHSDVFGEVDAKWKRGTEPGDDLMPCKASYRISAEAPESAPPDQHAP